MVFLNITWMERYEGLKGDDKQVSGGGSYVDKYGYGHEIYNFKNINGKLYGYAQPRGSNNLERMGANPTDDSIDNTLIIFTAAYKKEGTYIVGWYKNAIFYRDFQESNLEERKFNDNYIGYYAMANTKDSVLLPPDMRFYFPKVPRGVKGGLGQSNVWYADSPAMEGFKRLVIDKINQYEKNKIKNKSKHILRKRNIELRKKVEKTAVDIAIEEYTKRGFKVNSVENENKGWDLEAYFKNISLKIEVKGLSSSNLVVELTPNEFKNMDKYKEDFYRLAVVTETLTNPILNIFYYSTEINKWISEDGDILNIEHITSARCYI